MEGLQFKEQLIFVPHRRKLFVVLVNKNQQFTTPSTSNLTDKQKEQFFALMLEYSGIIAKSPDDLGCTEVLQHHINTKDAILR